MEPEYETLTVYEVYWKERCYLRALSESEAIKNLKELWAYGEAGEVDEDGCVAIGNKWASHSNEDGWRIVPKNIKVMKILGEIKGSFDQGETVHLIWQCPKCEQYFSEDVEENTKYPILVLCSCKKSTEFTYYLVDGQTKVSN